MARITLGMQCFWGAEAIFGSHLGIIRTRVGYSGGSTKNPTYRNIGDHIESVDIEFDPNTIKFEEILELFMKSHDPTIKHKRQYMSAIFYRNADEKNCIEQFLELKKSYYSSPIVTGIVQLDEFTNAENYHQKYFLRKHPSIMQETDLQDDSKLITSPLAAKLNGICAGFGAIDYINEQDKAKLSQKTANLLETFIKNGPNIAECGL
ncbi:methionine sulfoxide reductase A [Dermatophagoides farinae]|uniref:peptide-methionine (S)-S-oxide reductase n=1 Tax=Dermatophagoides farinae TaxID=6954 RepID=A0A9D4P8M5_DERFA|nr:peptide methionine sulfoxide reductase MsrA-like [Dermatophagoides farinae]KAH7646098.1 peptide methionine sulfoxide reductase [Dermatophagoides farinae]